MKTGCRVTPGGGNPRESATEKRLPLCAGVTVKRWGKSPPGRWQQGSHGKPHPEQCRIGALSRAGLATETAARVLHPQGPGWQLDRRGNTVGRGMVIQGSQDPGQNPAYRPSAQFHRLSNGAAKRGCQIGLTKRVYQMGPLARHAFSGHWRAVLRRGYLKARNAMKGSASCISGP